MIYTTTLQCLRENNACIRGYDLIANHVGRDFTGNIPLETILNVNGLDDAIWALRATDGGKELAVAFAIYCVEPYYTEKSWVNWASEWMARTDRSAWAADAAAGAAEAAEAAGATGAATWAAARAAEAAGATGAATWAATWAAAGAAGAAAGAAEAAAAAGAAEKTRQTAIFRKLVNGEA